MGEEKITLKKYLKRKQLELYEHIHEMRVNGATDEDVETLEAQLQIVNETIDICKKRNKY